MQNPRTITLLLSAAESGDQSAFDELYALTYAELRALAHHVRSGHRPPTLNTTALVHEAYLKLVPGGAAAASDRTHFFRIAARAMRQVLVDAARRRSTRERKALLLDVELADAADRASADVLDLDRALSELGRISPRQSDVVECRFFAGMSVEETAAALGVSVPTVKRDWRVARAWLADALGARP